MHGSDRVNILGVGLSALNLTLAVEAIDHAVKTRTRGYVCVTGVHGVMEAQDDPVLKRILNDAFLCTPDGMPMVWLGKLAGFAYMDRVYGPDLMIEVFQRSVQAGYRHFFYGGANGVAEVLADRLRARFLGVSIVGVFEPPFRCLNSREEHALMNTLDHCQPDIIWVGLSTPKQERFMADYLPRLNTTLMIGVGAAFDFHAGRVRQAPRWMQRSGLEWFFRLCREPRRLWRRYLKNNPRFVLRAATQLAGIRKFDLDIPTQGH